jgi:DNA-binding HxlR family transcriptional regulator
MIPGEIDVTATIELHVPGTCAGVSAVLSRVGDKWSVLVIMLLRNGPRRFNELRRMIGSVSQRMLTHTLRGLERDGLITRRVYPTIPPRVEYELSPLGRSLRQPVMTLCAWALSHQTEIDRARLMFDDRKRGAEA